MTCDLLFPCYPLKRLSCRCLSEVVVHPFFQLLDELQASVDQSVSGWHLRGQGAELLGLFIHDFLQQNKDIYIRANPFKCVTVIFDLKTFSP